MTTTKSVGISRPLEEVAVTPEAVRVQTELLLQHPLFRYSQRACNLLRFIVDRTLTGQQEELKERIIGIMVFGRAPDYDTSNDSTVRVVANEVRKRLTEYYAQPEHAAELRIELPIRAYLAEFRVAEPAPKELKLATEPQLTAAPEPPFPAELSISLSAQSKRPFMTKRHYRIIAALLLLIVAGVVVAKFGTPASQIDKFWAPVVKDASTALVYVGSPYVPSDSPQSGTVVPGSTGRAGSQVPFYDSEQRVFVRMLDANAASQLATFLRSKGKDSQILPTEGTQLMDLHSGPFILYGMALNEAAAKLGVDLHFRFRKENESGQGIRWIEDSSKPSARDWRVDLSAPLENVGVDFALISRVRDQTTSRWWIGIAGLTGVGTLAASQVVIDPKAMENICSTLPRDWENKNLQIVLEIKVVQGQPGATRVLTTYSW